MIDKPIMLEPIQAAPEVVVLPAFFPIPTLGLIAVNAFVLKSAEPVLVDTGLVPLSDEFMQKLAMVIDPSELRWLWLTHCHFDHLGSLQRILAVAPKLRVIIPFLGVGIMSLFQPLPLERAYLLNPGQSIDVGDRTLQAVVPPSYDSPETTGFYDPKTAVFFSADCFGALLSSPAANAAEVDPEQLREGLVRWATVDAPWLHMADRAIFNERLNRVRKMAPKVILSSHLPVAQGMTEELLQYLGMAPDVEPFVGPDQAMLEALIKGSATQV